ncbi:uncharacterized protein N7479_004221 [Penicillium vulpinum]|uniref:uncharacterized protein n=1 Tax=Penicillium vulpinum TaxID=29845 RepID=UPI002546BD6F|nr:uncharacterized protein N7479_004221 [Penicillium vulpinum]KAJ5964345.1 hypothetical protein N7479_004221 [Penicillium vulpinum]
MTRKFTSSKDADPRLRTSPDRILRFSSDEGSQLVPSPIRRLGSSHSVHLQHVHWKQDDGVITPSPPTVPRLPSQSAVTNQPVGSLV